MQSRVVIATALATVLAGCGGNGGSASSQASTGGDGGVGLVRDAALGAKYGLPGPRACQKKNAPGDGPPSADQVAALVTCSSEHEFSGNLYVIDQLKITGVAPGRPYNPIEDRNMGNIDINKPVYAIRGSYNKYQCNPVVQPGGYDGGEEYHKGTNCNLYPAPAASGSCYIDTFGDWTCGMIDVDSSVETTRKTAPPAS